VGTGNLNIVGPAAINSGGYIKLGGGNVIGDTVNNTLSGNVTGYGDVTAKLVGTGGLATASGSGKTLFIDGGAILNNGSTNASLASSSGAVLDIRSTLSNPTSAFTFTGYVSPSGGTVNLDGATLTSVGTSSIDLTAGTANVTGDSTVSGKFQSEATLGVNSGKKLNIQNSTAAFTGDVTNNGTVHVTNSTVTWGNLTNNGALISDPSTQTFINLTEGTNSYIQAAAGDVYQIKGDFINHSTQNTSWNTTAATLSFITGTSSAHTFALAGANMGGSGSTDNFAWGTLDLTGQTLALSDGDTGNTGTALYVDKILGAVISGMGITNITGTDHTTIYYNPLDNPYLLDKTYSFVGGGSLTPIPVPPSLLLLGSGLLGMGLLRRKCKAQQS
jgi:hypothetical protein